MTSDDQKKPATVTRLHARKRQPLVLLDEAHQFFAGMAPAVMGALELAAALERAERRAVRWPLGSMAAMQTLVASFPSLNAKPGTAPWDAIAFLAWLCSAAPSDGARCAGRFVLSVWDPRADWVTVARDNGIAGAEAAGRFDLHETLHVFDEAHRAVMLAWIAAPFWP